MEVVKKILTRVSFSTVGVQAYLVRVSRVFRLTALPAAFVRAWRVREVQSPRSGSVRPLREVSRAERG